MPRTKKSFDFDLTIQLVGGQRTLAREIIDLFISQYLPEHITEIKQALLDNNFQKLLQAVHKFHGAVCYCGTPKQKDITGKLETAIKIGKTKPVKVICCVEV